VHVGGTANSKKPRGLRRTILALSVVAGLLFVPAVLFVRHPGLVLGAGTVDPESKALSVNPALAAATSVISVAGDQPVSLALKPKTIALTFDDGPSPEWTARIESVLDEYGVPGTFFVIGSNAAKYPDVVKHLAEHGHEIGNHTYTHPVLGDQSVWRVDAQIRLTDRVVLGVTGSRPDVFRPPYSGGPTYLSAAEYGAVHAALGDGGRLLVLSDRLPRDFDDTVSIDQVVSDALPAPGQSAIITMHDAGGDRSRTVDALRILIPRLQAEGYTFVRASDIVDRSVAPVVESSSHEQNLGRLLIASTALVNVIFRVVWVVAILGVVLGLLRIVVLAYFVRRYRTLREKSDQDAPPYLEPVTVIIPAYNEEVGIANAVLSVAASEHPDVRIIVVDDGSSDATSEIVLALGRPDVTLIRQVNSGKPAALNTGIEAATTELVVMVDGDTIFDPNTVHDVVQPFRDPRVGAVAGNAKVGNRKKAITRMQHVEYTVASELERRMYGVLGVSPCVPGAIGAFRRSALLDVGGVSADTLAEDSDLTVALARAGWRIDYVPTARAWTEAPSNWSGLLRQRRRWSYGVLQVMAKHRGAMLEGGNGGRLARVAFPYQLLVSYALAIFAPAIDLVMFHNLVLEPRSRVATVLVWTALNTLNAVVNLFALRLDGERFRSVWWVAFAQQFIYRQVLYIAALRSMAAALVGVRLPWQTPRRVGGLSAANRVVSVDAPAVCTADLALVAAGAGDASVRLFEHRRSDARASEAAFAMARRASATGSMSMRSRLVLDTPSELDERLGWPVVPRLELPVSLVASSFAAAVRAEIDLASEPYPLFSRSSRAATGLPRPPRGRGRGRRSGDMPPVSVVGDGFVVLRPSETDEAAVLASVSGSAAQRVDRRRRTSVSS
jgi:cellulose synthase/poly-beta-1,6-N-acetylglucosamine synthase-like glycosyltransferase/peptidoglycan/xylan/chitin deacetylase (PgdA/CDA1 family)